MRATFLILLIVLIVGAATASSILVKNRNAIIPQDIFSASTDTAGNGALNQPLFFVGKPISDSLTKIAVHRAGYDSNDALIYENDAIGFRFAYPKDLIVENQKSGPDGVYNEKYLFMAAICSDAVESCSGGSIVTVDKNNNTVRNLADLRVHEKQLMPPGMQLTSQDIVSGGDTKFLITEGRLNGTDVAGTSTLISTYSDNAIATLSQVDYISRNSSNAALGGSQSCTTKFGTSSSPLSNFTSRDSKMIQLFAVGFAYGRCCQRTLKFPGFPSP